MKGLSICCEVGGIAWWCALKLLVTCAAESRVQGQGIASGLVEPHQGQE